MLYLRTAGFLKRFMSPSAHHGRYYLPCESFSPPPRIQSFKHADTTHDHNSPLSLPLCSSTAMSKSTFSGSVSEANSRTCLLKSFQFFRRSGGNGPRLGDSSGHTPKMDTPSSDVTETGTMQITNQAASRFKINVQSVGDL